MMLEKNQKSLPRSFQQRTVARTLTALTEIPQFCSLKFPTPGRFRT